MPTLIEKLESSLKSLEPVTWSNSGEFLSDENEPEYHEGWVKFGLSKSENGWRALEFIAWIIDDLQNSNYRIRFVPTSPPPYINTPGECLSFVIEIDLLSKDKASSKAIEFFDSCIKEYWPKCHM